MALTPYVRAASFLTRAVTSALTAGVDAVTYIARAVVSFPTPEVQVPQVYARTVIAPYTNIQVPQFITRAVVISWPGNPKVRAWGYSQDGHDFYVLHLGAQGTIVYDATTGSWSTWDSTGRDTWRANYGLDWLGMSKNNYDNGAVTQIVAGDENLGVLWTLDPTSGVDDHPTESGTVVPFTRVVRGGYPITERNNLRVGGLWLRISTGEPVYTDTQITLRSSDDQGNTWTDHGTVPVDLFAYGQTIFWRSLGLIRPPLRIFEFSDVGAMVRIDGADIEAK